jgi:hypothetical protein
LKRSRAQPRRKKKDAADLKTRRARAHEARQRARRLRADAKRILNEADELDRHANELDRLDAESVEEGIGREDMPPLPVRENTGTVDGMSTESWSHALKIAHGRAKVRRDALAAASVRAGMTKGEMVEKVRKELKLAKLPMSGISQARSGTRPIRRDVAEAIERLIGFKATKVNWPGGIRDVSSQNDD